MLLTADECIKLSSENKRWNYETTKWLSEINFEQKISNVELVEKSHKHIRKWRSNLTEGMTTFHRQYKQITINNTVIGSYIEGSMNL